MNKSGAEKLIKKMRIYNKSQKNEYYNNSIFLKSCLNNVESNLYNHCLKLTNYLTILRKKVYNLNVSVLLSKIKKTRRPGITDCLCIKINK